MHLKQPIVPKMPHVFERLAAELFGIPAGRCGANGNRRPMKYLRSIHT